MRQWECQYNIKKQINSLTTKDIGECYSKGKSNTQTERQFKEIAKERYKWKSKRWTKRHSKKETERQTRQRELLSERQRGLKRWEWWQVSKQVKHLCFASNSSFPLLLLLASLQSRFQIERKFLSHTSPSVIGVGHARRGQFRQHFASNFYLRKCYIRAALLYFGPGQHPARGSHTARQAP